VYNNNKKNNNNNKNNNNKTTIYKAHGAVTWLESLYKGAVQYTLLVLWKQSVGTREQMRVS